MKSKTLLMMIQSLISLVSANLTRSTLWLVRKVSTRMSRVTVG